MSWSLADARFQFHRATGLVRRGLASLRTRGWQATWNRAKAQLGMLAPKLREPLVFPSDSPAVPVALPAAELPVASIVIPAFNHLDATLRCLRALAMFRAGTTFEVILVDDASTDASGDVLPGIPGIRYLRRESNGGFIAACNDGAALARGEYLVFLNNDTLPQPDWLDALLATFARTPYAGLVGAQLLYPDGRLQEAGGRVLRDGGAESIGRFADPDDPAFAYMRKVDYCSGAALAMRRALFEELGGLDPRYAPAYYEDTDLAMRVRQAGSTVYCQPLARVVHEEGTTSGTDPEHGIKAFQRRNRDIFARRWHQVLHGAQHDSLSPRQVLVIDALTPTPDRDSGSLRLVNLLRVLLEEGAHVVFLPSNRAHAGEDTRRLQALGVECWYAPYAKRAPAWLREHGPRFDTVMLCRHYVAREFLPLVRRHAPRARVVFDTIDLHYLRERRGAEVAGDAALMRAAERTRALELDVIARSDATLVVSEAERALLARDAPEARVEVLSNLHHLAGPGQPFGQRRDLVFVGGFRHPPNVDAVRWFVEAVFPRVRERLPDVVFHCIGGHVPDAIATLASRDGVVVHGHVPDIDPYMDGCRVALAPLRYGAGVKGKVNLSMAHGQPVVATGVAVEGMHLRDGHDVLVADGEEAFADAVVRLCQDQALWERLAANGLDNVRRHFSPDAARGAVRRVFFDDDVSDDDRSHPHFVGDVQERLQPR